MNGSATLPPHDEEHAATTPDAILERVLGTLRTYRRQILLLLAAVALGYVIVMIALLLLLPSRRVATLPFRFVFSGAQDGVYPNGLKFGTSEMLAVPVLTEVYQANHLNEYMTFGDFSRAFFVTEANEELERLTADYRARLADLRLSPVDRERLEREFDAKRAAVENSEYAIHLVRANRTKKIPKPITEKILRDTLNTWARQAVTSRRVLENGVSLLSGNVARSVVNSADPGVGLLVLRRRADAMLQNLDTLRTMPGVMLVRTDKQKTLAEVRLDLQDVIRFHLDPMILSLPESGAVRDRVSLIRVLEAQLDYDKGLLDAAESREAAVRRTMDAFDRARNTQSAAVTTGAATPNAGAPDRETVMPQLTESFLDRMLELTNGERDQFRQRLAQDLSRAATEKVPAQSLLEYDQMVLEAISRAPLAPFNPAAVERLNAQSAVAASELRAVASDLESIYAAASRQLHPATELFAVSGPMEDRTEWGADPRRLALYGLLVLLLSLPLIVAGCMLHERSRARRLAEV